MKSVTGWGKISFALNDEKTEIDHFSSTFSGTVLFVNVTFILVALIFLLQIMYVI